MKLPDVETIMYSQRRGFVGDGPCLTNTFLLSDMMISKTMKVINIVGCTINLRYSQFSCKFDLHTTFFVIILQ